MIKRFWESIFGKKVGRTRVLPVSLKIVVTFTIFILVSNLSSNYINLSYNLAELVGQMKELLIKDLKDLNNFCNNQHEIYRITGDLENSIEAMETKALSEFKNSKSIAIGIRPDGTLLFEASKFDKVGGFSDIQSLARMEEKHQNDILAAAMSVTFNNERYISVYRYNSRWDMYILRAEEINEFYGRSRRIFATVSIIILVITIFSALLGILILRHILRFVSYITDAIMKMSRNQQLEIIDLGKASADDITFLGASFNSLSSSINNLVTIFRKFANRDVAIKAYRDKQVKLEGSQKELSIIFSDIKGFTFITETLGIDIIKLLNLHYDSAIRAILRRDGIIGSIIGDALLAVYGVEFDEDKNKSYEAILSAYELQEIAANIRMKMHGVKEKIIQERGALTPAEEKVYKAVLLEIGVGIDGGTVFYGTIGSTERMTNTVIGDNVNAASRLEGLTRVYKVPIICSEFIKNDIEANVKNPLLHFVELDTVQVKGKTIGKKIYWPIMTSQFVGEIVQDIELFSEGLQLYYEGDWRNAYKKFNKCTLPLAEVFKARTKNNKCPEDWSGVWEMKTK
jgi:class 3 adenylate cyclase